MHSTMRCPNGAGLATMSSTSAIALSQSVGPIARGTARGRSVTRTHNWKTFGPSSSYSDGDADYFRTTDRLTHQYDWFGPKQPQREEPEEVPSVLTAPRGTSAATRPEFGLSSKQIQALGLTAPRMNGPDPKTLSSRSFLRGDKIDPSQFGYNTSNMAGFTMAARGRSYQGARSAYGDYQTYPEGRPLFLPEAERFGTPPDLPSLLLQQRIIYISMPVCAMLPAAPVGQHVESRQAGDSLVCLVGSAQQRRSMLISREQRGYAIAGAVGMVQVDVAEGRAGCQL
ncbi:hypothetical protein V8C86DRAFT_2923839, partial [Haematococcus lacustris]